MFVIARECLYNTFISATIPPIPRIQILENQKASCHETFLVFQNAGGRNYSKDESIIQALTRNDKHTDSRLDAILSVRKITAKVNVMYKQSPVMTNIT